jgi:hypothetical protein
VSIYVDLIPPPQFDRSLVAYTVGNFQRIKDALGRASGRIYVTHQSLGGPWPNSISVNIPFKSDILYIARGTCYSTTIGFLGLTMLMDGNNYSFLDQYFNETSSHKTLVGIVTLRSVAAGTHTFGTSYGTGGLSSDSGDRYTFGLTCVEV